MFCRKSLFWCVVELNRKLVTSPLVMKKKVMAIHRLRMSECVSLREREREREVKMCLHKSVCIFSPMFEYHWEEVFEWVGLEVQVMPKPNHPKPFCSKVSGLFLESGDLLWILQRKEKKTRWGMNSLIAFPLCSIKLNFFQKLNADPWLLFTLECS